MIIMAELFHLARSYQYSILDSHLLINKPCAISGFSTILATHSQRGPFMKQLLYRLASRPSDTIRHVFILWVDPSPIPSLSYFGINASVQLMIPVTILSSLTEFITDRFIAPRSRPGRTLSREFMIYCLLMMVVSVVV
jgi:hypothetical protein